MKFMLQVWLVSLAVFISGCALMDTEIEDRDFQEIGVPEDLIDRYSVHEGPEVEQKAADGKSTKATEDKKGQELQVKKTQTKDKTSKESKPKGTQKSKVAKAEAKPEAQKTKLEIPSEQEIKNRRPKGVFPFYPGERSVFSLTYFGMEAGTLDLRVLPYKYIGDRKVYHIRGIGRSTSVFALFYRVNDVGETFMDYDGLFSHKFQLKVDESLQKRDLIELYNHKDQNVYYWQKLVHEKKGFRLTQFTKEIAKFTQDAVSAAFYLRTLPLEVGKTYTFPTVSNGKSWNVKAHVIRREMLTTDVGKFPALVIKPETHFEGVLKKSGDVYFWLSDDEHRSFLKIDAKVKIGKVIAYIKKLEYGKKE